MTFKEYVIHQLREMQRELLVALSDVPREDMVSFEPQGHWPVAWIVEHCTNIADIFLYAPIHRATLHEYTEHVRSWQKRSPQKDDEYPSTEAMKDRWATLCAAVLAFVEEASDDDLQRQYGREPYIQSILRVINHTNSHLRSLWCTLGARRVDHKWAEQGAFLA